MKISQITFITGGTFGDGRNNSGAKYANIYTCVPGSFPYHFGCAKRGIYSLRTGATITAALCRRKGLKLLGTKVSIRQFKKAMT